jgi:hypothetical protein
MYAIAARLRCVAVITKSTCIRAGVGNHLFQVPDLHWRSLDSRARGNSATYGTNQGNWNIMFFRHRRTAEVRCGDNKVHLHWSSNSGLAISFFGSLIRTGTRRITALAEIRRRVVQIKASETGDLLAITARLRCVAVSTKSIWNGARI